MKKLFAATALIACYLSISACASGARPEAMTLSATDRAPVAATAPGYKTLAVGNVTGGGETNPLWMSGVSPTDFKQALEASLKNSGYLAEVAGAPCVVNAELLALERPPMGLDLTVKSVVKYSVTSTGKPSFEDTVTASGVGKLSDQLIAVERLRLANQNSMKANISKFLDDYAASLKK